MPAPRGPGILPGACKQKLLPISHPAQRGFKRSLPLAIRRLILVPIVIALVFFSPLARGAILERLKNGENLTVAAIGTSLTATDWGFWFQPTGDWLNGQGFPGKVTLANRAVCGSASKLVPGTADYRDGVCQLADLLAKDNPDAVFNVQGAKAIIVPSVQQALQSQLGCIQPIPVTSSWRMSGSGR